MSDTPKNEQSSQDAELSRIGSSALFSMLLYVANESQRNPMESVRDIVNEAFDDYGFGATAEWSVDENRPIVVKFY